MSLAESTDIQNGKPMHYSVFIEAVFAFAWQRNCQQIFNTKQLSYECKKKTFSEFQTQSSFIIKYLLICLRFSELIFHFLWMDPLPAIFGWIQYWLCTPISYLICWVSTDGTKGQMCHSYGLFLGLRSLFRSLIGRPGYDQRWLEMVARFELLT